MLKNVVDYQNSALLTGTHKPIFLQTVNTKMEFHRVEHFITIYNVYLTETIFRGRDRNLYNFAMEFCQ